MNTEKKYQSGRRLGDLRKQLKLTQTQLCAQSGITQGFLSAVERGHSGMTYSIIEAIAYSYDDVDLRWLITGKENNSMSNNYAVQEPEAAYGEKLQYEVLDNCMLPHAMPGDVLGIAPIEWKNVQSGKIYVVDMGKEGRVCRYVFIDGNSDVRLVASDGTEETFSKANIKKVFRFLRTTRMWNG